MTYHIAQINIARTIAPMDSPIMSSFVERLDDINALAENSEGFVWRLKGDNNNASSIRVFEDDALIVNMSVWKDIDTLHNYAYHTAHTEIMKRKKEWFEKMREMYMALWYVPQNHVPTVAEAEDRLNYLRENGPTPYAFTFKQRFSYEEAITFADKNA